MNIVFRWLILVLAVVSAAYFVPGIHIAGVIPALVAGVALTVVHTLIRPIMKILTLPVNIMTLGLFSLVINGLLFWFTAALISGFDVTNYLDALFGSIIVSSLNWLADRVIM
jgi:putative membrane protein